MKAVKSFVKIFVFVVILAAIAGGVVANWSWVFSKRVIGKVVDVERVTDPTAIMSSRASPEQMYSYSILIQGNDGQLYTSSSEDRQWQVVKKGYCVDVLLYRNPPWHLDMANTFFNARLKSVNICPGESSLPAAQSQPQPQASPTPPAPGSEPPPAAEPPKGR